MEAALTGAGFDMREIKFQPNATGRTIVSDSRQAALLEFSGLPKRALSRQENAPQSILAESARLRPARDPASPRAGDWLDDEIAGWRDRGTNVAVSLLMA